MRTCQQCNFRADFFCLDCGALFCARDVLITRQAFGYRCDHSVNNHAFVPIIQEYGEPNVRAANPKEARAEGQKVALLLNKLVDLAPTRQFQDASKFGQFFAMDVLGYRDGELAIAWTEGFCNGLMEPEKAERVAAQYVDGKLDITALLKLPPGAFSPSSDEDDAA